MKWLIQLLLLLLFLVSCEPQGPTADIIIHNAEIHTLRPEGQTYSAIAIKGDRILGLGTEESILKFVDAGTNMIDARGNFLMPGLIEGHGHFLGFGRSLMELDLLEVGSWAETIALVSDEVAKAEPGRWITGRGWHQDKWTDVTPVDGSPYPDHLDLSVISPDNPVILIHASGHSLIANERAMKEAGITRDTPDPDGGTIRRDEEGNPIGVFEETAMYPIREAFWSQGGRGTEEEERARIREAALIAQEEAFRHGITSFQDAGLSMQEIGVLRTMANDGELDIRLWIMLLENYESMRVSVKQLPIVGEADNRFTVAALKAFNDGALGSYGALLIEPYSDKPEESGQLVTPEEELRSIAALARDHQLQYCVHAIGDLANKMMLDIYEETFEDKDQLREARWRIEHAQHLRPEDINRFAEFGIIAAMQTIHCASDAAFVVTRLGEKRAEEGAYMWRSLIDAGVLVTNGTDVPVERINPFTGLYAAVSRKLPGQEMAFYPEQSMTREEALRSYTINNAIAAFEEDLKGSLEEGKLADLILLDRNLLTCEKSDIPNTKVLMTMVGGKIVYED
ncbi:MAG: amidohydrolase [Saprospirales bacterium]|nr:MAG: amidohydrolase [Saprospirales bacterium]